MTDTPNMTAPAPMRGRSAKIVATIGPGSRAPDTVKLLAQAGVDVFRMNFSHGTHEDHHEAFNTVRSVEEQLGRPLAVLADLQGPKIRVGRFPDGEIRLGFKAEYTLKAGDTTDDENIIPVPHPKILAMLEAGDEILLNDGQLMMTVVSGGGIPPRTVRVARETWRQEGLYGAGQSASCWRDDR